LQHRKWFFLAKSIKSIMESPSTAGSTPTSVQDEQGVGVDDRKKHSEASNGAVEPGIIRAGDGTEIESEEDRIEWLRSRGVFIDIPNERLPSKKDSRVKQIVEVNVVKIPYNELLPYEDVVVSVDLSAPGDQLITALASRFSSAGSEIDKALLQESAAKQFGSSGKCALILLSYSVQNIYFHRRMIVADITISESTLETLASKGSVEVFHLAHACEANR
jgi:hypothetical protein